MKGDYRKEVKRKGNKKMEGNDIDRWGNGKEGKGKVNNEGRNNKMKVGNVKLGIRNVNYQ